MKFIDLFQIVAMVLLVFAMSVNGAEGKGKKKKADNPPAEAVESKAADSKKEPVVGFTISSTEKEVIQSYVKSFDEPSSPGNKPKKLPPGLQKKVARGGKLPPGWEKKLVKTEVMPVEVYHECHPLPPEVVVKLPPPPAGVITVTISGKVVRLLEATREILDVFEVGR